MGERVDYSGGTGTNPPFASSPANPTIIDLPASSGTFQDVHSKPAFAKPYVASSYVGTQIYRYRCVCNGVQGPYVTVMGPISITREVYQSGGKWYYKITKSGVSAIYELPP